MTGRWISVGRASLMTDKDGRVRVGKPKRRQSVSDRIKAKKSKRVRVVKSRGA